MLRLEHSLRRGHKVRSAAPATSRSWLLCLWEQMGIASSGRLHSQAQQTEVRPSWHCSTATIACSCRFRCSLCLWIFARGIAHAWPSAQLQLYCVAATHTHRDDQRCCAEGRILSSIEETDAAAQVRSSVVDALQDSRESIEPFLTMPWDTYCKNMAASGTWGGVCFACTGTLNCIGLGQMSLGQV
jgi:hypothetical protein